MRKARFRAMNEPPHLTLAEEIFNAVSHGAGALVAVAGMVLLLVQSDTGMKILGLLCIRYQHDLHDDHEQCLPRYALWVHGQAGVPSV